MIKQFSIPTELTAELLNTLIEKIVVHEATDNLVVTDTFEPILNPITVVYNGTTWEEGTEYTYDEATGLFTTVEGRITVPAATYTQDAATGEWIITPGTSTLTVTGTI